MIMNEEGAREFVAKRCDRLAMERLEYFVRELEAENTRQNLVSKPSLEIAWQRHIADSAQLLDLAESEHGLWVDLGTGAGLPGLVLAIMRPDRPFMLIESRRKRVDWLERIRSALELDNCEVAGARLETVESVEARVISGRAFAPMWRILELSARFSTGDTQWLLPKGRSAEQDLQTLPKKIRRMFHVEQSQTDPAAGIIVGKLAKGAGTKL